MQPQSLYTQRERSVMSRRKRSEEHENHERWLVSYADFITLLFAFFVVMYSISSVNEGKYRVLSDSIVAAFRDPARSLHPIQVGDLARTAQQPVALIDRSQPIIELFKVPLPIQPEPESAVERPQQPALARQEQNEPAEIDQESQQLADSIEAAMAELMDQGLIQVRRDSRWIEVEINTSILFPSGSAQLSVEAEPVLREALALEGLSAGRRHLLGLELAVTLNETGRCDEAISTARQANAQFGDYALGHALLGNLLACSGERSASKEAKRELSRAKGLCSAKAQRRVADELGRDFHVMGCQGELLGWYRP